MTSPSLTKEAADNYPAEIPNSIVPAGCKSSKQFHWLSEFQEGGRTYTELKASFQAIECYNENAASDFVLSALLTSQTHVGTKTIKSVEINIIKPGSTTYYIWSEGNFAMFVIGMTENYAEQVAEALINSYK